MTQISKGNTHLIIPVIIDGDAPFVGMKRGDLVYFVYDHALRCYFLVRWHVSAWRCDCGERSCEHCQAMQRYQPGLLQGATRNITCPAAWPQPAFHFGQTVYEGQRALVIIGMRLGRVQGQVVWIYAVSDGSRQCEIVEAELSSEPLTVNSVSLA